MTLFQDENNFNQKAKVKYMFHVWRKLDYDRFGVWNYLLPWISNKLKWLIGS